MSLLDDITSELKKIMGPTWNEREGKVVPVTEDINLRNDAVKLDATILYADMAGSTHLVTSKKWQFAAEIYQSFLYSACKIIRANDGEIVSFDGDRVMAVFIGGSKNSNATKTGLQINFARQLINKEIPKHWKSDYEISHAVGIDTSDIRACRTGIRGSNDLVWVGRCANYAAKLCDERSGYYRTWITEDVYSYLSDQTKYSDGKNMWEQRYWTDFDIHVYCSSYHWSF